MSVLVAEPWHLFGVGLGQAQIIAIGLTAATAGVLGYRFRTRGKRYERG